MRVKLAQCLIRIRYLCGNKQFKEHREDCAIEPPRDLRLAARNDAASADSDEPRICLQIKFEIHRE